MATNYNKNVSDNRPEYHVRDWVMLKATHIPTLRPTKKLNHKMHSKFQVEKLIGTHAIRLTFLPGMGGRHRVFHTGELEPYSENNIPGRTEPTPLPVDAGQNTYEIEEVWASKYVRKKVVYLVAWKRYGPDQDTWELGRNLLDGGK